MSLRASRLAAFVATLSMASGLTSSSAAVAAPVVRAANPESLKSVLLLAKGGDTIVLGPGNYSSISIANRTFDGRLVIDAKAATIEGMYVNQVEGLEIRGGDFRLPPPVVKASTGNLNYGAALRLDNVKNVRLTELTVTGPGGPPDVADAPFGEGDGVKLFIGADVHITASRFSGLKNGLALGRVDGFEITRNVFSGLRSDGISLGEGHNGLVQGNECRGTRIRDKEHPDCIQLFSRPTSPPTADIVIRGNRAEGATQGIFLGNHTRDGVSDGGFDRILIEDNDLNVAFPNAIALIDGRASVVRNNRIQTFPGAQYPAVINIHGDIARCGNAVAAHRGRSREIDHKC
jgi:hypothetical protein